MTAVEMIMNLLRVSGARNVPCLNALGYIKQTHTTQTNIGMYMRLACLLHGVWSIVSTAQKLIRKQETKKQSKSEVFDLIEKKSTFDHE